MDDTYTLALSAEGTTTVDTLDSDDREDAIDDQSMQRIAQQVRKWLDPFPEHIAEQQFISLVRKCGIMNVPAILELFTSLDFERTGSVKKHVLLQNNYLASLITVCSSAESE